MELNFSYNWNKKLDCQAFTTIRHTVYPVNTKFKVYLKSVYKFDAIVRDVRSFKIPQLNQFMSYLDTGYPPEECAHILRKMYEKKYPDINNETFYIYLIVKV